jgi:hypothetical protein
MVLEGRNGAEAKYVAWRDIVLNGSLQHISEGTDTKMLLLT